MQNNSISFLSLLFLIFLILKLCDVITWSWWWVFAPLWGPFALVCIIFLFAFVGMFVYNLLSK